MFGIWRWLETLFATSAPGTNSGQDRRSEDPLDPATVGKLAIDARNALLEIHFRENKDRRAPRRFTGALHVFDR